MNACSAGHLCQAGDRFLNLATGDHHQVGKLIDDDDDVGKMSMLKHFPLGNLNLWKVLFHKIDYVIVVQLLLSLGVLFLLFFGQLAIVTVDISHALVGHQLVAALHFANRPVEGQRRFFRIGYDRQQEMWNAFVHRKLQHLRVNHDDTDITRVGAVEK